MGRSELTSLYWSDRCHSYHGSTTDNSFKEEEKLNIGEKITDILQAFDIFSHIVTEDFFNMIVLQTSKYSA